ncbi:GntR family transcriptional regulator [Paenibacillus thalictri]|uniref:GntR family transcriptional regulator n=1 Tax=Paenibacillus thalictri TaxID=2527873 RepID=A0A4Q9DSM6_9BACL|nr:GntR family transcriptional regulator [Paenibacillus thalictri]TBL79859.1 GntR family transcriptional regulator [Paenibacillus thalictri]
METKEVKGGPAPMYVQIADSIREQIDSGIYLPGSKLPKEASLVEMFNTSRITLRAALKLLADEGVIVKHQGVGTFVSDTKKTFSMNSVQGFYSILVKSGAKVQPLIQNNSSVKPPKDIAEALKIPEDTIVRKIERLFLVNEQPIAITTTHFNQDFEVTEEEADSILVYGLLIEKMNTEPMRARYHITAAKASDYQSIIFSSHKGAPILVLNEVSYNNEGLPLEHTSHYIRPDMCELEFMVVKNRPLEDLRIKNVAKVEF